MLLELSLKPYELKLDITNSELNILLDMLKIVSRKINLV